MTCRYGGIIEVVEVPDIEVSEMNNEESEGILPLESKWLEEHTRGMKYEQHVTLEFLDELGWNEIADYFIVDKSKENEEIEGNEESEERSDWMRVCKDGV